MRNRRNLLVASIAAGSLAITTLMVACHTPTWADTAESIVKVSLPIVQGLVVVVDTHAAPLANQVVDDINVLLGLLDDYRKNPTDSPLDIIQAAINTVQVDLGKILPALHVSNPDTVAKITAIINLVSQEIKEVASLLPQPSALATKKTASRGLSADEFKAKYNAIVAGDPAFKQLQ
jgi:hypothetical protein